MHAQPHPILQLFTHCATHTCIYVHRMNLRVVKCCSIWKIGNMIDAVVRFFSNSPNRQFGLDAWIDDIFEEKQKELRKCAESGGWNVTKHLMSVLIYSCLQVVV